MDLRPPSTAPRIADGLSISSGRYAALIRSRPAAMFSPASGYCIRKTRDPTPDRNLINLCLVLGTEQASGARWVVKLKPYCSNIVWNPYPEAGGGSTLLRIAMTWTMTPTRLQSWFVG